MDSGCSECSSTLAIHIIFIIGFVPVHWRTVEDLCPASCSWSLKRSSRLVVGRTRLWSNWFGDLLPFELCALGCLEEDCMCFYDGALDLEVLVPDTSSCAATVDVLIASTAAMSNVRRHYMDVKMHFLRYSTIRL
ncbi:hypothetical protein Tco_0269722 [Tanacetum coccineum]